MDGYRGGAGQLFLPDSAPQRPRLGPRRSRSVGDLTGHLQQAELLQLELDNVPSSSPAPQRSSKPRDWNWHVVEIEGGRQRRRTTNQSRSPRASVRAQAYPANRPGPAPAMRTRSRSMSHLDDLPRQMQMQAQAQAQGNSGALFAGPSSKSEQRSSVTSLFTAEDFYLTEQHFAAFQPPAAAPGNPLLTTEFGGTASNPNMAPAQWSQWPQQPASTGTLAPPGLTLGQPMVERTVTSEVREILGALDATPSSGSGGSGPLHGMGMHHPHHMQPHQGGMHHDGPQQQHPQQPHPQAGLPTLSRLMGDMDSDPAAWGSLLAGLSMQAPSQPQHPYCIHTGLPLSQCSCLSCSTRFHR